MVSRQDEDCRREGRPGTKAIRMAEGAFSRPCSTDSVPPVRGYPAAVAAQGRPGIPRREKLSGAENPPVRREGFYRRLFCRILPVRRRRQGRRPDRDRRKANEHPDSDPNRSSFWGLAD